MIGADLAHFRITAKLGAGGMGEVYRAEDSKLGRQVAIKVLPPAFVAEPDRLARFEREARTLASLSHPNIASIYEVGREDGTHFLVMELAPGETLAERIARGPVPLEEALPIAQQVAAALEAAHERGIVHRDLKPANVMVDADGGVKVLDFGLAKALVADGGASAPDLAHSPTLTQATRAGVLLGTVAYMSPEQARGQEAGRQADIWAFGVLLWEMLTGKPLFAGETIPDVLAGVLSRPIDAALLPLEVPRPVRRAIDGCLARDRRDRWRHIGDVALLLRAHELHEPPQRRATGRPGPALLAGFAVAVAAAALLGWLFAARSAQQGGAIVRKLEVARASGGRSAPAIVSPDGRWVAFQSQRRLWVRPLESLEERAVPESDDTSVAIWSPDSRWLAYQSGGRLLKVPVEGGRPQVIARLPQNGDGPAAGGGWGEDGRIVLGTGYSGLLAVSANGGEIETLLAPAPDESDYHQPHLLPDGQGVIFAIHLRGKADTPLAVFRDGRKQALAGLPEGQLSSPWFDPSGFLLFERSPRGAGVWAVPFSLRELRATGEPFLVAAGGQKPSADRHGNLLYHEPLPQKYALVWVDRTGRVLETLGEPMTWLEDPHLAPDAKRVAFVATDDQGTDVFVRNLERGTTNRLTFSPDKEFSVRWSPGGDRLVLDTQGAEHTLHVLDVESGGTPVAIGAGARPVWGPGGSLVFEVFGARGIWTGVPGAGPWKPTRVLDYAADESAVDLSPDGRYLVFLADPSGRNEVYVTRFPSGQGRWQVSRGASFVPPVWSPRGDEIFYVDDRGILTVAAVETAPELAIGAPQALFEPPGSLADYWTFSADRDGQRLLMSRPLSNAARVDRLIHVQDWRREFAAERHQAPR